jgi:hypothetical protein
MICLRPHVVLLEDFLVDVITNLIIYSASRPPKCLEGLSISRSPSSRMARQLLVVAELVFNQLQLYSSSTNCSAPPSRALR